MTPQLAGSISRADRAGKQLDRVARLRAMSVAELSEALGADPETAAPWVEAAAACGMSRAQVQWGRMLLVGTGVSKDEAAALRWFKKAAMSGDSPAGNRGEAQNMVGRCYEAGWGTCADLMSAARWFGRSADCGDSWGIYNLANLLFDGRGIAEDRGAAVELYERAARLGHTRAMNLLGRCLEEGWGTRADPIAAADWYRRSAEGGYFRAQYNHGIELVRQGRREAAAEMFRHAWDAGLRICPS